jgi:gentisate 1,2-dioxygenase
MKPTRGTEPSPGTAPYAQRLADAALSPLWTFFHEWFAAEPKPSALPHLWRYDALRDLLLEAARAISTAEAERRVLVLENPGLRGRHLVTDALYAGLQLIMPGEHARTHRHTAAALRFIVEGAGAYTAVAGERAYMEPGDFIVTPSWAWHEHRNESSTPTVWLDVLDVPLVRFLGAGFSEHYSEAELPTRAPPGDSHYRYGRNLLPVGFARDGSGSPVFSYPYAHARETLDRLAKTACWDPCHALKMEYVDPTNGGPAIPTISTFLQLVPKGFTTRPVRSTASAVYAVVAGRGTATIGGGAAARELAYEQRDVWAAPSWQPIAIRADEETVLFSASDEAAQRKLGIWRESRDAGV